MATSRIGSTRLFSMLLMVGLLLGISAVISPHGTAATGVGGVGAHKGVLYEVDLVKYASPDGADAGYALVHVDGAVQSMSLAQGQQALDMAAELPTLTVKWTSNGIEVQMNFWKKASDKDDEFTKRVKDAVDAMKKLFPPDPPSSP